MIYRRQRQQYIFAGFLAVIALVNVLFFFILNRPAHAEFARLQTSIKELENELGTNQAYFSDLERTTSQLDRFDKDKRALLMMHLIQRNTGYSQIVSTLEDIVERSGVNKTRVNYNLDPMPQAGLNPVSITLPLQGSYNSVVKFIRELENSDTFFLITSINLEGSTQPIGPSAAAGNDAGGATAQVGLSLALETYFYQ